MIAMKRLCWLPAFSIFISCTMHEEYTPPSPIELKPRQTQPTLYDQGIEPDKFGDEGLESADSEEKETEEKDTQQIRRQDDIAMAERKRRAHKLTPAAEKNIKIERTIAGQSPAKEPVKPVVKKEIPQISEKKVETPKPTPKKISENITPDLDDLDDVED